MKTDSLQVMINEIRTSDDYILACTLLRNRIRAGAEVDSGVLLSLAAKGHLLQPTLVSQQFMSTLATNPGTMEDNVS